MFKKDEDSVLFTWLYAFSAAEPFRDLTEEKNYSSLFDFNFNIYVFSDHKNQTGRTGFIGLYGLYTTLYYNFLVLWLVSIYSN